MSNADRELLREQRDDLTARMEEIEARSEAGDMDRSDLQSEMREMRARMDMLTREMSRYLIPPSYASTNSMHESQDAHGN
jgi:chromosome segregation ATPase